MNLVFAEYNFPKWNDQEVFFARVFNDFPKIVILVKLKIKIERFLLMVIVLGSISITSVFAESPLEWESDYRVGILDQSPDSWIPVKVSTFSHDTLKIEWESPEIQKNEIITGYKILRKDMNSSYRIVLENTNSKDSSYIDKNLPDGYYAYKVVPIIEKQKSDKITMHGIQRMSNIFDIYKKGQELLAKNEWNSEGIQSQVPDSKSVEYKKLDRTNNPVFQGILNDEILKAQQLFEKLFDVKINH